MVALFVFAFASIGCTLAARVDSFLICLMLQSGIIAGYAMSLAIIRDTRTEKEAVSLNGYIGMAMAIAPMIGPMLGGVLDTFFGWRSVFGFYAIAGRCFVGWISGRQSQKTALKVAPRATAWHCFFESRCSGHTPFAERFPLGHSD